MNIKYVKTEKSFIEVDGDTGEVISTEPVHEPIVDTPVTRPSINWFQMGLLYRPMTESQGDFLTAVVEKYLTPNGELVCSLAQICYLEGYDKANAYKLFKKYRLDPKFLPVLVNKSYKHIC